MIAVFVAIGLLAGALLLLAVGRYNQTSIEVEWDFIVTPAGRLAYEDLRQRFAEQRAVVDVTYDLAHARAEEAAQLLAAGYSFLEHVVVERRRLLEGMARYSRMVGAIAPVPALRPGDFHLRQLVSLVGIGAVGHHFLITVPERVRLRLLILRGGLGVVLRAFGRAARPAQPTDWHSVERARADWNTLSAETLDSFQALVTSVVLPSSEAAARLAAGR